MTNLNELIPAGARKAVYLVYGILATLVAAAGQGLTTAHEVGIETGDLSKYVAVAGAVLLVIGGAFGFTAAAHVLKTPKPEPEAVEDEDVILASARRVERDEDPIPGDDYDQDEKLS